MQKKKPFRDMTLAERKEFWKTMPAAKQKEILKKILKRIVIQALGKK